VTYAGPFESFPQRIGVDLAELEEAQQGENASSPSGRDYAPFLQAWLCFGIMTEVSRICSVHFDASGLIGIDDGGLPVISFAKLETYAWFWCSAEYCRPIEERNEHLRACYRLLRKANAVVNRRNQRVLVSESESKVLLSIMGLADYLAYNGYNIFTAKIYDKALRLNWNYNKRLNNMLLQEGWCRGELKGLYHECSSVMLLYMSTISRARVDKDHSTCSGDICVANQLDNSTYVPSHAADCTVSNCSGVVESDVSALCDVLNAGGIPLVRLSKDVTQKSIEIGCFDLCGSVSPRYVAISHVWSDGMGNPKANGLHACQLQRIQNHVNHLFPEEVENVFFWMDTLCVPLRTNVRNTAIIRMAKTYAHAAKVLVLDSWLEQSNCNGDPKQLLTRISKCDWNQWLWTYQEALLARECRFQLASECPTIDHLLDHNLSTRNIDRISNVLASLSEHAFLQHDYIVVLLKAMTHIDETLLGRMTHYSQLQPQEDEDEEDLRLFAIQYYEQIGDPYARRERLLPLLEKWGDSHNMLVFDESLRIHLSACIFDPVVAYGIDALRRVRAIFQMVSLDRQKDLDSRSSR
ncbi:hypothetical protein F5Y09DRAFT_354200, partial [Xylaria sp. FL1042]